MSDQSDCYAGLSAWNTLPSTLSLSSFRCQLKHFYFSRNYYTEHFQFHFTVNALYNLLTYLFTYFVLGACMLTVCLFLSFSYNFLKFISICCQFLMTQ